MSDVTQLLQAIHAGDHSAAADLLPRVYDALRALAASWMARESPDHTLQPTALVHEAYLRLVGSAPAQPWDSRGHFFAAAAQAMRRILIDHARRKQCVRHGGAHTRVEVDLELLGCQPRAADLLAFDESLAALVEQDARAARLVELRCFCGLSVEAAAEALGISSRTAYRDWAWARAWLYRHQSGAEQRRP